MFNFTAFIRRKWTEYSLSSGQMGTVIDELAVKPTGLILGDFYNTLVKERRTNDITNWENMSEDEMDFFGNKFFKPRVYGRYSFGYARIYFDQKQRLEISPSTMFVSSSGFQFRAVQPGYISTGSFIRSTDRFALYYVDVPVVATAQGNAYNIAIGDLSQITGASFTYKMVTNPEAFTNGLATETNEQYYKRLLYSINDGSMMNKRSAFARLPEFFPTIRAMHISAPGDRYMQRDLVEAVDLSSPERSTDFLGKCHGENIVKNIAFYQIFPPEAGNINGSTWGPKSIPTSYKFPLTIEPIDVTSQEPALHGYALNQEFEDDKYKGLFFDDLKTAAEIRTNDLYNIANEQLTFTPVVVPSSDWVYGAHGLQKGNFGPLAEGAKDSDIINFSTNVVKVSGGALNSVSVGKDIKKRIGIKVSGSLVWPNVPADDSPTAKSNVQVMVGGINSNTVDGYTGVGFGVRVKSAFVPSGTIDYNELPMNAVIYFAHAEKYGTGQVYANDNDFSSHTGISDIGALAEKAFRIESGVEYEFEFIIYDDLRMTLYLNKVTNRVLTVDPAEKENNLHFMLQSSILNVYKSELMNVSTTHYGTTMKISLDTLSQNILDTWSILNLKAFDISEKRATALLCLNVEDIEDPIRVSMRASGTSSIDGLNGDGYQAYIWDKEAQGVAGASTELTAGGWSLLPDVSNPDGSKDATAGLFFTDIDNAERYRIQNRFGKNIFILISTTGTTKMKSRFANEVDDDIHSILHIDYAKIENKNPNYYHANNKADYFVTTLSNQEQLGVITTTVSKQVNESYFELSVAAGFSMPIAQIISISLGTTVSETQILSQSDYTLVRSNPLFTGSSKEIIRIYLNGYNSDSITVQYTQYPDVARIQDFFDGEDFGKIFGNVLVRHTNPINLDFTVYYSGAAFDSQVTDVIKQYFDQNIDGVFVVKDFISFLYNQGVVNNVKEPITFTYSRYDDNGNLETGTFTDQFEASKIEFFRINSLTVNTL